MKTDTVTRVLCFGSNSGGRGRGILAGTADLLRRGGVLSAVSALYAESESATNGTYFNMIAVMSGAADLFSKESLSDIEKRHGRDRRNDAVALDIDVLGTVLDGTIKWDGHHDHTQDYIQYGVSEVFGERRNKNTDSGKFVDIISTRQVLKCVRP